MPARSPGHPRSAQGQHGVQLSGTEAVVQQERAGIQAPHELRHGLPACFEQRAKLRLVDGGRHPVSKTGVPSKGGITRSHRKASEKLILRRRKFGKHQQRPQTVSV